MAGCAAFDPLGPYVTGLTGFVDCHARSLGEEGYRALGYGSPAALALTGLLTIYVALIGYRMLLGDVPSLREGVLSAVKIGFVLALASQWPAYQTLVYNVVIDGPNEIAARILDPGGLGGGNARALTERVQGAYAAIEEAARPEPVEQPVEPDTPQAEPNVAQPTQQSRFPVQPTTVTPPIDTTLGLAGQILLVASLAGLLSVRVVAGLMLALGPVFIACFLFGAMRGLFEGWVRVLAGVAFGAIGVGTVLAVELAIVEPQVGAFLRARAAEEPLPLLSGELLASTALFALVLLAVLVATTRAAAGFRLPDALRRETLRLIERMGASSEPAVAAAVPMTIAVNDDRPRARAVADALDARQRHEQRAPGTVPDQSDRRSVILAPARDGPAPVAPVPLGQSHRRTATQRRSASAGRRDAPR